MYKRLRQLDTLLQQTTSWWREAPFKLRRPAWCAEQPALTRALLALSDDAVRRLETDRAALQHYLLPYLPQLQALEALSQLPHIDAEPLNEARYGWAVPGRKQQQIAAFAEHVQPRAGLLEWCGGKGHLGRALAQRWQQLVATVERDAQLCEEGERLAQRVGVRQIFHRADALQAQTLQLTRHKHVLALHACGELHRQLIRHARSTAMVALDIAPCCYHLGQDADYRPFNAGLCLQLTRDDLRLAVSGGDTAPAAQLQQRDKEMAWKLGFIALREFLHQDAGYQSMKPIPKAWFRLDYDTFLQQLALREAVDLPQDVDAAYWQQQGWQRQGEVMRLNLVRLAFRRAIELWLVLDMAVHLQEQGYAVSLSQFCEPATSPRNILISARPA